MDIDDINSPIPYAWRYGWSSEEPPQVNSLLKAVLEKNVPEMNRLFDLGASIDGMDTDTFERALYFVVNDYPVMKCLVDHGFSIIENYAQYATGLASKEFSVECTSPEGLVSGLAGRAYFLGSYDVMELLVSQGFDRFDWYEKGWQKARHADDEIFLTKDERGIQILLENGYDVPIEYYREYVLNRPQVVRKTISLDPQKYDGQKCAHSKEDVPFLFGRKNAIYRNKRRKEDYQDWLRAYNEFRVSLGENRFRACQEQKNAANERVGQIAQSIISRL